MTVANAIAAAVLALVATAALTSRGEAEDTAAPEACGLEQVESALAELRETLDALETTFDYHR